MPDFRLNCWFLDCTAGFQFALPRLDRREAAGSGDGKLLGADKRQDVAEASSAEARRNSRRTKTLMIRF